MSVHGTSLRKNGIQSNHGIEASPCVFYGASSYEAVVKVICRRLQRVFLAAKETRKSRKAAAPFRFLRSCFP